MGEKETREMRFCGAGALCRSFAVKNGGFKVGESGEELRGKEKVRQSG